MKMNRKIWTFGNHEPVSMYRRTGKPTTGGVQGNALWLEDWHNWYDSEACVAQMASLGLNILHCRFYKGMGWEYEKKDFPQVKSFVRLCHKHRMQALGYVQFSTLFHELMGREIPDLAEWTAKNYDGTPQIFGDQYWRWLPCINQPKFVDYLEKILTIMMTEGEFDGVMFDNVFAHPCYCPRCRDAFRAHLRQCDFPFLHPEMVLPPPPGSGEDEIMDPVRQEMIIFGNQTLGKVIRRLYGFIKERRPDFIVSGNWAINRREGYLKWSNDHLELLPGFDLVIDQSGNEPGVENGCIISKIPELKMMEALGMAAVPLTDGDAGNAQGDVDPAYVCSLFENLFYGSIPVDRCIMRPEPGGGLNAARMESRRPLLAEIARVGRDFEKLLELPAYEPVGLVYSSESIMLSQSAYEAFVRAETSLLRGHVPYRRLFADSRGFHAPDWMNCETIILPGAKCLSEMLLRQLKNYRGRLALAGAGNAQYDERYRQRAEVFLPETEHCAITPHEILEAGWCWRIRHAADDWHERFATAVTFNMPPEVCARIKMDRGKVAAILLTAPVKTAPAAVKIKPELCAAQYWRYWPGPPQALPFDDHGDLIIPEMNGASIIAAAE